MATVVLEVARAPGSARRLIAERAALALELLLAAGLLRLAALETLEAYAMVAAIILIRQVIGRGIRSAARTPPAHGAEPSRPASVGGA